MLWRFKGLATTSNVITNAATVRTLQQRYRSIMTETRPMYNRMLQKFRSEFNPTHLEVIDESTLHAEHAAMRESGYQETHFKVIIVSDKFAGKLPVQRHRMVYSLLNEEFQHGLHAVNIEARTPAEFQVPLK